MSEQTKQWTCSECGRTNCLSFYFDARSGLPYLCPITGKETAYAALLREKRSQPELAALSASGAGVDQQKNAAPRVPGVPAGRAWGSTAE
jgi:hypothetical protein